MSILGLFELLRMLMKRTSDISPTNCW